MNIVENYFEIFELPVGFDIDLALLAQNYREVLRVSHPDKYVNSGDRERRLSAQLSVRVNDAYKVLKSPLLRAKYLLNLRAVDGVNLEGKPLDSGFLMEQMDLRESLAAVTELADLSSIERDVGLKCTETVTRLSEFFSGAVPGDAALAMDLINKLQFYEKLLADGQAKAAALE